MGKKNSALYDKPLKIKETKADPQFQIAGAEAGQGLMTVRETAARLGCHPETVKGHIRELWPGLMRNGVTTYLIEDQVTVILEKMKRTAAEHRGAESVNLQRSVAGIETSRSRALRIDLLYRQIQAELEAEIDELKTENARLEAAFGREVLEHRGTKAILAERETGLATVQRIAEAGGLLVSDREDMRNTYRREKG